MTQKADVRGAEAVRFVEAKISSANSAIDNETRDGAVVCQLVQSLVFEDRVSAHISLIRSHLSGNCI